MTRTTVGYLCTMILAICGWFTPVWAIDGVANAGPTCDEITSGYICDGTFVPEFVVTAPRIWHPHPRVHVPSLASLSTEELTAFMSSSLAAILAARNHAGVSVPKINQVRNRQVRAARIVEYREKIAKIDRWVAENSPSCELLHDYAALLGMIVVTGSSLAVSVSFPGIVVGVVITSGATLNKHYVCY